MRQNEIVIIKLNLLLDDFSMYKKLIQNLMSSINSEEVEAIESGMEELLYKSETEYIGKRIKEIANDLRSI